MIRFTPLLLCLAAAPFIAVPLMAAPSAPGTSAPMAPVTGTAAEASDATTEPVDRQAELDRIRAYMDSLSSLKATFIQTDPNGWNSTGSFALEKPGKLRFDYDDPVPLLIVSDGTVITMVDYDLRQVTRWPINDTPLRPLVKTNLVFGKDAEIVNLDIGDERTRLTVVDPKNRDEGMITLTFTREPFELDFWTIEDARGDQTIVSLQNMRKNVELDKDLWDWDDPRPTRRRIPGGKRF